MHKGELEVITYDSSNSRTIRKTDSIVDGVIDKLVDRSLVGKKKYGVTMDREDLTLDQWTTHVIEELLDATLYLAKIKSDLKKFR